MPISGGHQGAAGFFPQFIGQVETTVGGLWMEVPEGTGIDAPSGHDYTVPAPEPGGPALILAGGATLLAARARAKKDAAPGHRRWRHGFAPKWL